MYKGLYNQFRSWYQNTAEGADNAIFIYSDPHFSNDPEFRENYIGDDEQVKRINRTVGKNGTLILLGDIGNISFLKRLKGHKVLLLGNHDPGVSNYIRKRWEIKIPIIDYLDASVSEYWTDALKKYPEDPAAQSSYMSECFNALSKQVLTQLKTDEDFVRLSNIIYTSDPIEAYWIAYYDNHLIEEADIYEGALMLNDRLIISHEPILPLPPYLFNIHGHDHSNQHFSSRHMNVCAEHCNYTPIALSTCLKEGLLKQIESIHRYTIDKRLEVK